MAMVGQELAKLAVYDSTVVEQYSHTGVLVMCTGSSSALLLVSGS